MKLLLTSLAAIILLGEVATTPVAAQPLESPAIVRASVRTRHRRRVIRRERRRAIRRHLR